MTPGQLRMELYELDVSLKAVGGELVASAPKGVLTPELASEVRQHKTELVEILQAEAEHDRLHGTIFEMASTAETRRLYGDTAGAEALLAEVREMVEGPYSAAAERLLALLGDVWSELPGELQLAGVA